MWFLQGFHDIFKQLHRFNKCRMYLVVKAMSKGAHFTKNYSFYKTKKTPTLTRTCQTNQMNEIAAGKTRTHNNRPITRLHNYPFYRGRVPWLVILGILFSSPTSVPCGDNCPRYTRSHTHSHTDHQVGHDRRRNKRPEQPPAAPFIAGG